MIGRLARRLLLEEISSVRLRIDFTRERLSSAHRDAYRRGFHDAKERFSGLPRQHPDPHRQVDLHGVAVDEGMATLLDALWKLDLDTQYSCQGHPERYIAHEPATHDWDAHIVFGDTDQATKFLNKTIDLLGYVPFREGSMSLQPMPPVKDEVTRASVGWPPALLEEITSAWVAFERTVPVLSNDALA